MRQSKIALSKIAPSPKKNPLHLGRGHSKTQTHEKRSLPEFCSAYLVQGKGGLQHFKLQLYFTQLGVLQIGLGSKQFKVGYYTGAIANVGQVQRLFGLVNLQFVVF